MTEKLYRLLHYIVINSLNHQPPLMASFGIANFNKRIKNEELTGDKTEKRLKIFMIPTTLPPPFFQH